MKIYILCISVVLFALPSFAEIYSWVDDQGTVNFTEDRGSVPARYRKKVKIFGDVELPPAEINQGGEKPPAKGKTDGTGESGVGAQAPRQDKPKTVYGGKDAETWKSEFAALDGELKSAEKQLVETRNRMKDTSGMSRSEYLSIQTTLMSQENSVLQRRKKMEDFKSEAAAAGVPTGLLE
jgi:hypothetical protein